MLQAGIKIGRRNINNLRYAGDTTLMAEIEDQLKSMLMTVKEESERASLKLSIKKTKIMASYHITSWQIEGVNVEAVTDFLFLSSKITVNGDCSHEIRRQILLSSKQSYDKPRQCIKNQIHHFADKGPYSQGYSLSSSHAQM